MRKLILIFLFFAGITSMLTAQNRISGTLKDKDSQLALSGIIVQLQGTDFTGMTGTTGLFEIMNVPMGTYTLLIKSEFYAEIMLPVEIKGEDVDLGEILMTLGKDNGKEVIVEISNEELESEDEDLQSNVSGILHSSEDVFLNAAGFTFGPLRFRLRGYDNDYTSLFVNGIQTNDPETGRGVWAYWGGLNDAFRNDVTFKGIAETDFTFGDVGGATNVNTRASMIRVGTKLTYSFSNRNYHHRAMFLHSTGLMENGWAFAISGSKRYALEGYSEGTPYDAYSYFLSAEKKFNDNHSLGIVAFGAPSKRGGTSATTQEVYDLAGVRYNPNWGWQDGEKRNARMTNSHTPFVILTHYWDIDKSSKLQSNLAYSRGQYNRTSLNWYEGSDPRPDYYRYLPNYIESEIYSNVRADEFINGERQIDWDAIYQANYTSIDSVENADGILGNTVKGRLSQYILENQHNENNQLWFNTVYRKFLNENLKVTAGIQYRYFKARHYNTLEDLLGGDFIVDVDKYASRDLAGEGASDNDIRTPNHIIDEIGEVMGNDYFSNIHLTELWAQASYKFNKFDFYLSGKGSYTNYWRTGNMQSGKFPENSLGDSEKLSFINYGAKGGVVYKMSGMHYLHADAAYLTKAPDFQNAFISPRTRNEVVEGLTDEKVYSVQGGYILQSSKVKAVIDLFYSEFRDQSEVRSFYFDGYNSFVNFVMSGIEKKYQGLEIGIEYNIMPGLSVYGVGNLGYYRYSSRPEFSVYIDNSAKVYIENETVYIDGFLVSGTPQTAFSGGVKYFASKYWWIGANFNYLDDSYLTFSALTRTASAVKYIDHSSEEFTELINQDKLASFYTVDAFLGKSFRFNYKYYLNISLNVSNILNKTDIITGGYEQARIDASFTNLEKFPPKYYYAQGIQYFLNVNFRF